MSNLDIMINAEDKLPEHMKHHECPNRGSRYFGLSYLSKYELNKNSIPFLGSYNVKHVSPLLLFWWYSKLTEKGKLLLKQTF